MKTCVQEETISKITFFGFFITSLSLLHLTICIIIAKQGEITCQVVSKVSVTGMYPSWKCTKGSSGFGKKRLGFLYFLKSKNEKIKLYCYTL